GLLCGLRVTGFAYAAALAALLLIMRWWATAGVRPSLSAVRSPALATLCVGSCLFIGFFWYLRNALDYGNILGPVPLSATRQAAVPFRSSVFSLEARALALAFNPFAASNWKMLAERGRNELGLPLLIMLAQLALWPLALRRNRSPWQRQSTVLAALLLLGTTILFIVTPTSAMTGIQFRMGFPALAALAV